MQGTSSLPNAVQIRIRERAGELCPNVVCMGKEGIYTTAQGLCVAYFGGRWDPSKYAGQEAQEVSALCTMKKIGGKLSFAR